MVVGVAGRTRWFHCGSVTRIGLIQPGAMGASIGAAAVGNGHMVVWASQGRSPATTARAERAGLRDVGTTEALVETSDIVLAICPPHAADNIARQVADLRFRGIYADCNAISPRHTTAIGQVVEARGASFVDGGIIGGPAWGPEDGTTLYLSGRRADEVAACFATGPLTVTVISDSIGAASAVKMSYAAYTKGTTALLTAILGMAEQAGVRQHLERQWGPGFTTATLDRVRADTAKAWRFEGEMHEIADSFGDAGLPSGFHRAAAEVFSRLAGFRQQGARPEIGAVLKAVLSTDQAPPAPPTDPVPAPRNR